MRLAAAGLPVLERCECSCPRLRRENFLYVTSAPQRRVLPELRTCGSCLRPSMLHACTARRTGSKGPARPARRVENVGPLGPLPSSRRVLKLGGREAPSAPCRPCWPCWCSACYSLLCRFSKRGLEHTMEEFGDREAAVAAVSGRGSGEAPLAAFTGLHPVQALGAQAHSTGACFPDPRYPRDEPRNGWVSESSDRAAQRP